MHNTDELIDEVASLDVFWGCNPAELRRIARVAERVWLEPGEHVCDEGNTPEECFVVTLGEVDIVVGGRRFARHGRGQIIGELGLLAHTQREATIVAVDRAVLLRIPAGAFSELLLAPGVSSGVIRQLARRLHAVSRATTNPSY